MTALQDLICRSSSTVTVTATVAFFSQGSLILCMQSADLSDALATLDAMSSRFALAGARSSAVEVGCTETSADRLESLAEQFQIQSTAHADAPPQNPTDRSSLGVPFQK